ncbi:HNH endonuclease [Azotobacter chroococcum]|uniref:HNH endonuclease n=1 Tax=Azotobacter chroococcum TaxID=353 RepID=UPI00103C109B|nr:HNH endonuclease [Azotobacter chroococcum]
MYPELREALQQLGWIPAGESTQTRAKSVPRQPNDADQLASAAHDSMFSIQEIITTLENAGFARPAQSGLKVVRLEHPGLFAPVFVKQSSSTHARLQAPLVLHPQYEDKLAEWQSISGLERGNSRYYHNSNLRGFPKRLNGGATEIAYGVDLGFRHMVALEELISRLLGQPQATAATPAAQEASTPSAGVTDDLAVTDTEREALIKARIGQSDYRDALLAYWGGCAVTDCTLPALLRASHIKPWRAASATERLDPYNGLLLTPNLDLAFDQGLITFDDRGQICLSSALDSDSASALNLHPHLRLRQIEARHQGYLAWHRDNLFRK